MNLKKEILFLFHNFDYLIYLQNKQIKKKKNNNFK